MKRNYIQPNVTVRSIALQQMIALSLGNESADKNKDVLSKEDLDFELEDFGKDFWGGSDEW